MISKNYNADRDMYEKVITETCDKVAHFFFLKKDEQRLILEENIRFIQNIIKNNHADKNEALISSLSNLKALTKKDNLSMKGETGAAVGGVVGGAAGGAAGAVIGGPGGAAVGAAVGAGVGNAIGDAIGDSVGGFLGDFLGGGGRPGEEEGIYELIKSIDFGD